MLSTIVAWIKAYIPSERGQDLIEYAMLSGLIALAIVGAVVLFGGALTDMAEGIGDCIDFDNSTSCDPGF